MKEALTSIGDSKAPDDMQQLIVQHTGFVKGLLPFRYLDVSDFKEAVSRATPTTNRHDNGQNYNMDS